jgi:hypothetical protein
MSPNYSDQPRRPQSHKIKFTKSEDTILTQLVAKFGENNWKTIASQMLDRTVRQCRERWFFYLAPSVTNGPWTSAEDALLCSKVNEFGARWKKLTEFFPGRTDINIKNHYTTLLRRQRPFGVPSAPPTQPDDSNQTRPDRVDST